MELILGTAQMAGGYGVLSKELAPPRNRDYRAIIGRSEKLGFSAIDTAPVYGDAEEIIGSVGTTQAIHTKLRPRVPFAESLRNSLQALRRDSVDVVYVHDTEVLTDLSIEKRSKLVNLKSEGAHALGASVYDFEDFTRVIRAEIFDVAQVPMNALDSRFNSVIVQAARAAGMRVYARSIFLQGLLLVDPPRLDGTFDKLSPYLRELHNLIKQWDSDPISALCRFVIERTEVDGLVIGVSTELELHTLSEALHAEVPGELLDAIESMSKPGWSLTDPRKW